MPKTIIPETDQASDLARLHVGAGARSQKKSGKTPPPPAGKTATGTAPKPEKELPEFVKGLTDIIAELILRGGHDQDVYDMVAAAVSHDSRDLFDYVKDSEERERRLDERVATTAGRWIKELRSTWPSKKSREPQPEPKTITERVRADARERLRDMLDELSREATPEEILLMTSIMEIWESSRTGSMSNDPDIALAEAFSYVLADGSHYIRVPLKHWALVEEYLELLDKGCKEGK